MAGGLFAIAAPITPAVLTRLAWFARARCCCVAGHRLQEDAAEDPLLAAELGLPPNLELYARNKLMVPLLEVLEKVRTLASHLSSRCIRAARAGDAVVCRNVLVRLRRC